MRRSPLHRLPRLAGRDGATGGGQLTTAHTYTILFGYLMAMRSGHEQSPLHLALRPRLLPERDYRMLPVYDRRNRATTRFMMQLLPGKCEINDHAYDAHLLFCAPLPPRYNAEDMSAGCAVQRWSFFSHRRLHSRLFSIVSGGRGGHDIYK